MGDKVGDKRKSKVGDEVGHKVVQSERQSGGRWETKLETRFQGSQNPAHAWGEAEKSRYRPPCFQSTNSTLRHSNHQSCGWGHLFCTLTLVTKNWEILRKSEIAKTSFKINSHAWVSAQWLSPWQQQLWRNQLKHRRPAFFLEPKQSKATNTKIIKNLQSIDRRQTFSLHLACIAFWFGTLNKV